MALTLIATPIGNPNDISLRGLDTLRNADAIILEERKESTAFLRQHGITGKEYYELNEHSSVENLNTLAKLCEEKNIALITDCGTPGFADPGADLVKLCRKKGIAIKSIPGPSSLMTLLSLSGERHEQFLYRGFLSAETETRNKEWKELAKEKRAIIIMDTPYRLHKILDELALHMSSRNILIGINLTQSTEQVLEGHIDLIKKQITVKKAEFIVLVHAEKNPHSLKKS